MDPHQPTVGRSVDNRQVLVEVGSRRFAIPFECPCCGALPDAELAIPLVRSPARPVAPDTARSLLVPYCSVCLGHVQQLDGAGVPSAAVMLGGLVLGIGLSLTIHVAVGIGVAVLAAPLAWFVRKRTLDHATAGRRPSCATTTRAVTYLGWSGTTTAIELESHTYAARFAEANRSLLAAETPQLEKLLEAHRVARLAVPSAVAPVAPPPASMADWIARLEASQGAVARRATLARALDALTDLGERQLVIQAAMKLEVAPIVAALATDNPNLRTQQLERAIEAIKADNIPEALQRAMLFELEQLAG